MTHERVSSCVPHNYTKCRDAPILGIVTGYAPETITENQHEDASDRAEAPAAGSTIREAHHT